MELQAILNEIDGVIQTAKSKTTLTREEVEFFGTLKKRTEEVDAFFGAGYVLSLTIRPV